MPIRRFVAECRAGAGCRAGAILVAGFVLAAGPAASQTLEEALAAAYRTNPTLAAARAELRGVDEDLAQARSGWLPTVTLEGSAGVSSRFGSNVDKAAPTNIRAPLSGDLNLSLPLYAGGSNFANYRRAKNVIRQQRARLDATEQSVLSDSATAFMDVVRDQAILELNVSNVQVLRRQLEATQDRFEVGENTRTDVAQAESRMARANAERIRAEGNLATSRATYQRIIGTTPGELAIPLPPIDLPLTLEEAIRATIEENPTVTAARFAEQAAGDSVASRIGGLLPNLSLDGNIGHDTHSLQDGSQTATGSVVATLSVPIYQGGSAHSQVRKARQLQGQRRSEIDAARTQAIEQTVSAWEALTATRAQIEAFEEEVVAAETALEGVTQENLVGARTVLAVLDAEQEMLDAQVNLVTSRRDEIVTSYRLLAAVGALGARQRGLDVEFYDPKENYEQVRLKFFGTGIGEE